jgi:hypothetical protein
MALRSGSLAGLNVGREHFEGALAFTTFVTAENGTVGYINPKGAGAMVSGPGDHYTYHPAGMSALGMLTRAHARNASDDFAQFRELASKQLVKDLPVITKDTLSIDYYYWYAGTLALSRFDPPNGAIPATRYWGPWRKAVTDAVLELQDKSSNPCASGGWMVADRWSTGVGPIYTTALNVLTLEVCARNPSPQAK